VIKIQVSRPPRDELKLPPNQPPSSPLATPLKRFQRFRNCLIQECACHPVIPIRLSALFPSVQACRPTEPSECLLRTRKPPAFAFRRARVKFRANPALARRREHDSTRLECFLNLITGTETPARTSEFTRANSPSCSKMHSNELWFPDRKTFLMSSMRRVGRRLVGLSDWST